MEKTEVKVFDLSDRLFYKLKIIAGAVLVLMAVYAYYGYKNLPGNYPREITVSAEGKAIAAPDIALVNLGVESEAADAKTAVKDNTDKTNLILADLKKIGIDEKDIKTTNYNVAPRYEWDKNGKRTFKGYTVTQSLRVKIRDFANIGSVLENSTNSGANLVGDLQFTFDDSDKIIQQAKDEAIAKAQAKAEQLAKQTGLKLVKITNVYENSSYPYPMGAMTKSSNFEGMASGVAAAPIIMPGQEEVKVTMNLVYLVK